MTNEPESLPLNGTAMNTEAEKASTNKPRARSRSITPLDEPLRKRQRPDTSSPTDPKKLESENIPKESQDSDNVSSRELSASKSPPAESSSEDKLNLNAIDDVEGDQDEGELPPLPPGPPPEEPPSDGWEAIWEPSAGAYYFYNHHSGETTWTNPRVPPSDAEQPVSDAPKHYTGYDPSIHGDYDPTAPYAQRPERTPSPTIDPYAAQAAFNRFTGRFQIGSGTDKFNEENRARRQMEIFFDVDAAANCHDGRSLKAERQAKKLTKKEVKAFREKTRLKKEEKKRAWLRD
ncbi:hypothetical protein ABW19_dt0209239 [Dactylella cylindrospora]|nr:hypothetical protein ABW19_dt0209239 [Dactylella cylindrospora]